MTLQLTGHVALPEHKAKGGFDHAAVHAASGHVYVAHTANDAVDVFDPARRQYLFSVPGLPGVAGALVSDESQLIFSSNRGENTIGVFAPGPDPTVTQDRRRHGTQWPRLRRQRRQCAGRQCRRPGGAAAPAHFVDGRPRRRAQCARDRGAAAARAGPCSIPRPELFYVNIIQPAEIVVVDARQPDRIARSFAVPACRAARPRLRSAPRSGCSAPAMPACSSRWTRDRARCWTRNP